MTNSRNWLLLLTLVAAAVLASPSADAQIVENDPASLTTEDPDDATTEAANRALAEVRGLSEAHVEVADGELTISGIANDPEVIERAEQAVRDATGEQTVNSELRLSSRLSDRVEGASARVADRFERWLAYLPLIPLAVLVLVAASAIAWIAGKWRWPYQRLVSNVFLQDIARRLVQSGIILAGALLALEILNATALVGGVLGAAGVAGIAIGFAFRDLVENYIASVLLSLRQPFRPRDHVEIDGHAGLITAMNSRSTVLTTFDGNLVRIPNATVFKSTLINYSSEPKRRFNFDVNVGYDVDLAQAIEVGVNVLRQTEGVLAQPSPFAIVTQLQDSSIAIRLFAWVDQRAADFGKAKSLALQNVKNAYDERDIDMPEPIYKLKLVSTPDQILQATPEQDSRSPETGNSPMHDIAPDHNTEDLARQTADRSQAENLLSADAPAE